MRRDEQGFFQVVDRIKDIFISGGESVAPAEVESVLFSHPAVADAAVIGVPDARWGEAGAAYVVARRGVATDEEQLLAWCESQLARFKVPRYIRFVTQIPRSSSAKVLRRELLAQFTTEQAEAEVAR